VRPRREPDLAPLPPMSEPIIRGRRVARPVPASQEATCCGVKFLYHPSWNVRVPVREDGRINIQGVGEAEARQDGRGTGARSRQYRATGLREPEVTVIIAELGPNRTTWAGKSAPDVPFREGMTPLQASSIAAASRDVASRPNSFSRELEAGDHYEVTRSTSNERSKTGLRRHPLWAVNDVLYVPRSGDRGRELDRRALVRQLIPVSRDGTWNGCIVGGSRTKR